MRPSAVRPRSLPWNFSRPRTVSAIFSMISTRLPPVSFCTMTDSAKILRSWFSGARRVMSATAFSNGMPSSCASNARANSMETGVGISVATILNELCSACPARSERAIISSASGSCCDSRVLR